MNPTGQPFGMTPPPAGAATVRELVNLPAIFLLVSAGLGVAMALLSLLSSLSDSDGTRTAGLVMDFLQDEGLKAKLREAMEQAQSEQSGASRLLGVGWSLVMLLANAVVAVGALKMRALQAWPLALTAALLSVVPCCFSSCCCVVAMPAGLWALFVLMKPEVKAAFT